MLKKILTKQSKFSWFKPLNHNELYSKEVLKLIKKEKMTMGESCYQLENKLKKILKVKHVILTTSGTSALNMATIALGINSSSKVLCTNMTWIATINPAKIMGAKIILVDTEKESLNVSFKKLNQSIRKFRPDVVYLVHLNGYPTYNEEFDKLKKKYHFSVIEDSAQSFPVKIVDNKYCGTKYEIGCMSLSMTKIINMVYGGFCVTNSNTLAQKLISIRNNGVNAEPEFADMELANINGLNLKPSDLHAKIGLINLNFLQRNVKKVRQIYKIYTQGLKNHKFIKILKNKNKNTLAIYILILPNNKKKFINFCNKNGIGLHFNLRALHETKLFNQNKKFSNSYYMSKNVVRLPSGPGYSLQEIKKITKILNKYKN